MYILTEHTWNANREICEFKHMTLIVNNKNNNIK